MKISNHARTRILTNLEMLTYAYLSWRVATYLTGSAQEPNTIIISCLLISAIILANLAGEYIFKKLKNSFSGSPPFAATAIALILTTVIIFNLKDSSLFLFSMLIMIYCRFIKGIAASKYCTTSNKFRAENLIAISAGCLIATLTPILNNSLQLAANIWRIPFLIATSLSLYEVLKYNILRPARTKAKQIIQAGGNSNKTPVSYKLWLEAILLCSFLIVELEIGGYYWLKQIVAHDSSPAILAFIISTTIFIVIYALLRGSSASTRDLLGWGFIGPLITAPLHFLIGINSNFVLAFSGQAFFMVFAAAGAAGITQRIGEIFHYKNNIKEIFSCWAGCALVVVIITNCIKQDLALTPLWIAIVATSLIWIMTSFKTRDAQAMNNLL
ncbi:MAG: hypothetical protein ABGY11_12255 [Candidatus Thioglobus sp.]